MIRDFRARDAPELLRFLQAYFPEEEALKGTRPEEFLRIVRRIYRWDVRLLLGLAALFGRRVFRLFVTEEDGRVIATTLLTFPPRAGFVSLVAVDDAYRRRGYATALLERAREATARTGRRYLALDVLYENAPARALYERLGFRGLRESRYMVRDGGVPEAEPPSDHVRRFEPEDAVRIAEIARRAAPPEVEAVLPVGPEQFRGSRFAARTLEGEGVSWVVDRGEGPEAYLAVWRSPAMISTYCSAPVVAETADPADVGALVHRGVDWCASRHASRILTQVPVANARGRAALEGGGFRDAIALLTLYRAVA